MTNSSHPSAELVQTPSPSSSPSRFASASPTSSARSPSSRSSGRAPRAEYVPFAEARAQGFRIGELQAGASVNDLLVENPTDSNVLLYEGEEVLGAQQNRTFDVSVLVGAGSKLRVPVSCVEAGPLGRRAPRRGLRGRAAGRLPRASPAEGDCRPASESLAGLEARADQSAVWNEVAAKSARMGVDSPYRRDARHLRGPPRPARRDARRDRAPRRPARGARRDRRRGPGDGLGQPARRVRRPARPARPGLRARRARGHEARTRRTHPTPRRRAASPSWSPTASPTSAAVASGSARASRSPTTASAARRSRTRAS